MSLKSDLERKVKETYRTQWTTRDGRIIPQQEDIGLGNDGINLELTMLYADLSGSTALVDNYTRDFAAEQYKTFLYCAAKIIRSEGGEIRSYDGDRVMGVYIGDKKNTRAVRSGLRINWAVKNIIQPALKAQYPSTNYTMSHVVGIDASSVRAVRPGIRGSNDIAWIGKAANYAAKLSSLNPDFATRISARIYDNMDKEAKFDGKGKNMWEEVRWTDMNNAKIYRSTYWWSFD